MRLRRTFLTALAPLIGMSALITAMAAAPDLSKSPLVRLIQSVIHLVTPPQEISAVTVAPQHPPLQAMLPLAALAPTPLGHSLWMLASPSVPLAALKRPQRTQLRC